MSHPDSSTPDREPAYNAEFAELDADHTVDIIEGPEDDTPAPEHFPENTAFRTPTPGDTLTEAELFDDIEGDGADEGSA